MIDQNLLTKLVIDFCFEVNILCHIP